jgi:hypothetical protein
MARTKGAAQLLFLIGTGGAKPRLTSGGEAGVETKEINPTFE